MVEPLPHFRECGGECGIVSPARQTKALMEEPCLTFLKVVHQLVSYSWAEVRASRCLGRASSLSFGSSDMEPHRNLNTQ